jgi:Flp pilus assembly protein TadD
MTQTAPPAADDSNAAPTTPSAHVRWIPLLLVLATLLTFGRVVIDQFGPIDDEQTLYANPRLNPPDFAAPDGIPWYWSHAYMSLYAPVTYTAWGVLAKAAYAPEADPAGMHLNPAVFHAASLAVHAAAVLLVYAILRRLLRRPWAAAAGALLFALHPLQVETVAWASGLKDVLSGALSLCAVWVYLRCVDARERRSTAIFYVLALVSFALALLAKSSAVTTPLLLLVIDVTLLRRPLWRAVLSVAPFVLLALPAAYVARAVQPGYGVPAPEVWQRPIVAGASLAFYLAKLVLPTGLAFDYAWRPTEMLAKGGFYAIALLPIVVAGLIFRVRRTRPALVAAGLLFVVPLLPVLGFVPFMYQVHSTVADHYVYLAMLGPALAVAYAVSHVPARAARPVAAGGAVVLAALAIASFLQLRFWHDPETLLRRTVAVTPDSALAHNNLGQIYVRRRELEPAEREFRAAADANPDYPPPHVNLVAVYSFLGRADDAIRQFHEVERVNATLPQEIRTHYPPDIFLRAGQRAARDGEMATAARYFEEAAQTHPDDPRGAAALQQARALLPRGSTRPAGGPVR